MADHDAHAALPEGGEDDGRQRWRARAGRSCARRGARPRLRTTSSPTMARTKASRRWRMSNLILMKQCGSGHMSRGRSRAIGPHRRALQRHVRECPEQRDVLREKRAPGRQRALLRGRPFRGDLPVRRRGRHRLARGRLGHELPIHRHRDHQRRRGLLGGRDRQGGLADLAPAGEVRYPRRQRDPPLRCDGQAVPGVLYRGRQVGPLESAPMR